MMKIKKLLFLLMLVLCVGIKVDAEIKCGDGKPGGMVSCVVSNIEVSGSTSRIKTDTGLTFDSCDICTEDGTYSLTKDKAATFKFKISADITGNKALNVTIAGESTSINVKTEETTTNENEISYTVTLVPGKGKSNTTKTCTVNSLNSTCNVTLDELDDENFTGWDTDKNCTEGSKGNIKVNKDVTYYACYKASTDATNDETNDTLLLKSLVVKNGEEEIDFDFSIRTREYNLTVGLDVESLVIDAVAQDEDVTVSSEGNDNLKEGLNKIIITLTLDGATSEYILNVNKTEKVEAPLLSNLVIGGDYNIDFQPEKFVYSVAIDKDISKLIIQYDAENEDYDVEVLNNENLKDGSQIRIIVSNSENSTSSTYIINVTKTASNLILYIGIGAILLVILVVLLIIVVKKGKKNNKSVNNTPSSKKNVNVTKVSNSIPEIAAPMQNVPSPASNDKVENSNEEIETLNF